MSCGLTPTFHRVVVGPREALRMSRIVLRDVNWIGDRSLDKRLPMTVASLRESALDAPPRRAVATTRRWDARSAG
jgi:hypothetical protein